MSFVFYDTETTGLVAGFDQILQMGAIRTDEDLRELERIDIRCQLLPYLVPSPYALYTNKTTPEALTDPGLPTHFEAMGQIRAKFEEWSPAVFTGYNTIGYDEGLLRQAFYQTLRPIYLTNTGGNTRSDVLRVLQAASIHAPGIFDIPLNAKGKPTFRLDEIARLNGFDHARAHEAMSDVEATIQMAKLVKERAPDLWATLMRWTSKREANDFLYAEEMVTLSDFYFGRGYTWLVAFCGENPENSGQVAAFDLLSEPGEYFDMGVEALVDVLNASPKVIRTARTNALPMMMKAEAFPEEKKKAGFSEEVCRRRALEIRGNGAFQERVGRALAERWAGEAPSPYIELDMYGDPGAAERARMKEFHEAGWEERAGMVDDFGDMRFKEFAGRLLCTERPGLAGAGRLAAYEEWRAGRIGSSDPEVPWMTVPRAMADLEKIMAGDGGENRAFLEKTKTFIEGLAG